MVVFYNSTYSGHAWSKHAYRNWTVYLQDEFLTGVDVLVAIRNTEYSHHHQHTIQK